jgi:hypothetical protein
MNKYSIICMWGNYDYNNNLFINNLINYKQHSTVDDNIVFLISGPFINNENYNIIKNKNCIKILYITEPIEKNYPYRLCYDLYKNNIFNIIIGCVENNLNSIKYPLYMYHINLKNKNIFNDINNYVKECSLDKKFCTLINTHDNWNTRIPIYNKLVNIGNISCPSNLLNNCSNEELNNIGNFEYIKKYLFNICSENTLTSINGYITEKLINCCLGGAIPIYCGWFDEIDEKIFNRNRILFYDPNNEKSLNNVYNKVKELMEDTNKLNDFYKMDIFIESAYDTCQNMHDNLFTKLKNIILQ